MFDDKLGKVQGVTAKLHIEPGTQPIFCRSKTHFAAKWSQSWTVAQQAKVYIRLIQKDLSMDSNTLHMVIVC